MPVDLDEAKRMLDGVTPGPWFPFMQVTLSSGPAFASIDVDGKRIASIPQTGDDDEASAIACFIAYARAAVPAMVAEIEALRAIIRECHGGDRAPTEAEFMEALGGGNG